MSTQTQTSTATWSKPFYAIQHHAGLKRGFQVTVQNYDDFAECSVFVPGCGFNTTDTRHDSIEQARAHGEAQAKLLDATVRA